EAARFGRPSIAAGRRLRCRVRQEQRGAAEDDGGDAPNPSHRWFPPRQTGADRERVRRPALPLRSWTIRKVGDYIADAMRIKSNSEPETSAKHTEPEALAKGRCRPSLTLQALTCCALVL